MFSPDFIAWLADFRLPPYDLRKVDGQYELRFEGVDPHDDVGNPGAGDHQRVARARRCARGASLRSTCSMPAPRPSCGTRWSGWLLPDLVLSDFGTRRRHQFLWQRWCVEALKEGLGSRFIGTSNVLLAMDADLEAIGTNAHELPMVAAAAARDDAELASAPHLRRMALQRLQRQRC
jgi:nicotinate phosphoribosyltransferase